MTLKEIDIKNFRCFKQFFCQFVPGVNVFIGRNGAGKTTLIHAIHRAVSFIFSNNRSLGKEFLSQGNNTLNANTDETDPNMNRLIIKIIPHTLQYSTFYYIKRVLFREF